MPSRAQYEQLTLADAVRWLAELHFDTRTRHLSMDEYELLESRCRRHRGERPRSQGILVTLETRDDLARCTSGDVRAR